MNVESSQQFNSTEQSLVQHSNTIDSSSSALLGESSHQTDMDQGSVQFTPNAHPLTSDNTSCRRQSNFTSNNTYSHPVNQISHCLKAPQKTSSQSSVALTSRVSNASTTNTSHVAPPKRNTLMMHIRTQTWASDSHELFDYETRNILFDEFKCSCMRESYHIVRVKTEILFLPSEDAYNVYACEENVRFLAQIRLESDGHYYLLPPETKPKNDGDTTTSLSHENETEEDNQLWLVVRYLRDRSVILTSDDVIRLGRYQLKIRDIALSPSESKKNQGFHAFDDNDDCETVAPDPGENISNEILGSAEHIDFCDAKVSQEDCKTPIAVDRPRSERTMQSQKISPKLSSYRTCRVCLCGSFEADGYDPKTNPLVAPCECKGSMEWIHLNCLRTWISGRLNIRDDCSAFFWKTLKCELCKVTYPNYVRVYQESCDETGTDKSNSTSDNPDAQSKLDRSTRSHSSEKSSRIPPSSVVLYQFCFPEAPYIMLEPQTNQSDKGIYVVGLAHNHVAQLGRGHESDIRLTDISVSRVHLHLRYQPVANIKRHTSVLLGSGGYVPVSSLSNSGCFILEDHHSKFGTLLKIRRPLRLDTSLPSISIQAGRTVITISLRRRWRLRMPVCILQQHSSSDIYVLFKRAHPPNQHESAADNSD